MSRTITFDQDSAGGYEVRANGKPIGHVGKVGRKWVASRSGEAIGEFESRAAAAKALAD